MAPASYQALADLVALVHLAVVVFVVGGLAVVWPGNRLVVARPIVSAHPS